MTEAIWKFQLPSQPCEMMLELPDGATPLSAAVQGGGISVWVLCLPDVPKVMRHFKVVGTGQSVDAAKNRFIATVQDPPYVWHVFEVLK